MPAVGPGGEPSRIRGSQPAVCGSDGPLPVGTAKPTTVRMLVCHRGVSEFGCELDFLLPMNLFWISAGFFPRSV